MARQERAAERGQAASTRAEHHEQAGRHCQRSYPVPDPKGAPDAACLVGHFGHPVPPHPEVTCRP
jgi:hypothetical protein